MISFSMNLFSQELPNERDKQYTPPSDSHFGKISSGSNKSKGTSGLYNPIKNALLFEPFWLFRGVAGVTYSRQILSKGLVASIGIGAQRRGDLVMNEFIDIALDDFSTGDESTLSTASLYNSSNFSSGRLMSQFSLTYYFDYDEMAGYGIEFGYRKQGFNMTLDSYALVNGYDNVKVNGARTYLLSANTFYVSWKNQWKGSGRIPFVHSLTYGIGIKSFSHDTFLYSVEEINSEQTVVLDRTSEKQTQKPIVTLLFTYSLGIGW